MAGLTATDRWYGVYERALAVTPSDAATFPTTRALYVGGQGGDLTVQMAEGNNVLFGAVPAGMVLPIGVTMVLNTGTTATEIMRLY